MSEFMCKEKKKKKKKKKRRNKRQLYKLWSLPLNFQTPVFPFDLLDGLLPRAKSYLHTPSLKIPPDTISGNLIYDELRQIPS
jgi:hypothetical protein